LAHKSSKGIFKKQFLEVDKQSLEVDKMDKRPANIVQKYQDHNKYTSKTINTLEITKSLSKMGIASAPIDTVEIPEE
ncbi:20354_t:CDS:1, partial [Racocetra persica]